jgi:hypothetical protein
MFVAQESLSKNVKIKRDLESENNTTTLVKKNLGCYDLKQNNQFRDE